MRVVDGAVPKLSHRRRTIEVTGFSFRGAAVKRLAAVAIVLLLSPTQFVHADGGTSCAAAQEIFSNSTYSGDTSTSTSFVGAFGGLPSPGPDLAFKFTAGQVGNNTVVTIVGGWNAGAVITASCGGNAGNPISAGTGTTTFNVPMFPLIDGQVYYFYITGNPSDNSGPSGAFMFTTSFPVTLQEFTIE
jgi:hypothetical protein